jgi:hypothetical protein
MNRRTLAVVLFTFATICSSAQKTEKLNLVKLNLTALVVKNYSFQYERILKKKSSAAISIRLMPSTSLPFKAFIRDYIIGDDPETNKTLDQMRLSNFAITPEYRFYLGKKGYGQGLYVAPFYRYASFKTNTMVITYQSSLIQQNTIIMSGKMVNNTVGVLFGAQWFLGKHFNVDLWLLGPHYGNGNGDFTGTSSKQLTPFEQATLKQELEDLDIPLTHKSSEVNANGATLFLDGPWGGVRAGINVGIRF